MKELGIRELPAGSVELILTGPFPSKKNRLRPAAAGPHRKRGLIYNPDVAAAIERIAMEARLKWGPRKPLLHPDVAYQFFVHNPAQDRDGMWTSVLDCLKRAGVIFDDSIRQFNGTETSRPAGIIEKTESPTVVILFSNAAEHCL